MQQSSPKAHTVRLGKPGAGQGVPASACRGFGAQPRGDEAVPASGRRGFGAQPQEVMKPRSPKR